MSFASDVDRRRTRGWFWIPMAAALALCALTGFSAQAASIETLEIVTVTYDAAHFFFDLLEVIF